jgi:phosphoribosylamine--glycine ligase
LKVLVIGSGGREHALAWRLARDGVDVLVAPGNAGTPRLSPVAATDIGGLLELAQREHVDLTVVGPEAPLALGVVDAFAAQDRAVFGPTKAAAQLEWSKAFAKEFLIRHGLPTAQAKLVHDERGARTAVARMGLPVVLKADGLAAGKGVFVAHTAEAVDDALDQLYTRRTLGAAAETVLVEELLDGPELSVLAFSDGERLAVMPPARDYKRLSDGDAGPNTGGMGGLTWPPYASAERLAQIEKEGLRPTLAGMVAEGRPYRGVLYAGLMLTAQGPRVLEFNCRFGDPECQLIMPLLRSSLVDVLAAVAAGRLEPDAVRWAGGRTYGVVLASPGYPAAPRLGLPIGGLDAIGDGVEVFHSGTSRSTDGRVVTAGGRVLTVVGADRDAVYRAAEAITFEGRHFRGDIGGRSADRQDQRDDVMVVGAEVAS